MAALTLQYVFADAVGGPDPWADYGRLFLSVATDRFSGATMFAVRWQEVVAFADRLSAFPIVADAPVVAQWGNDTVDGIDVIIRIEVSPTDRLGGLAVTCEAADEANPHDRVRTSFPTGYAEIDRFRLALAQVMAGAAAEAVLTAR